MAQCGARRAIAPRRDGYGRVSNTLTAEFKRTPLNMLGALIARGAIKAFSRRMNPSRYNGASLLGLRGLVFKSHGGADAYGYEWAIRRAFDAAKFDVLTQISASIAALMPQAERATPTEDQLIPADLQQQKIA